MSHYFTVAILVCAWTALPAIAYPPGQLPQRSTDAPSQPTQGSLDNQLLEGLGDGLSRGETTVPARSAPGNGPAAPGSDGVMDPFADGSDIGQQNPLARIGRQMRRVQRLLIQRNVSVETQQTQRQIVVQLDELIAALAASQSARKQRKSSSSSQGDQQAAKAGNEAARNGSGKPGEEGVDFQQITAMQGAVGEFWGHLPERFRGQMRSVEAIEFLPKYRKLIEDYYQRLAEDRRIQH